MIRFLKKFEVSRLHILDLFVSKHSFVSHNYRKIMRQNKNLTAASVSPVRMRSQIHNFLEMTESPPHDSITKVSNYLIQTSRLIGVLM